MVITRIQQQNIEYTLTLKAWSPHFSNALSPWLVMWFSNSVRSCPNPSGILATKLYMRPRSKNNHKTDQSETIEKSFSNKCISNTFPKTIACVQLSPFSFVAKVMATKNFQNKILQCTSNLKSNLCIPLSFCKKLAWKGVITGPNPQIALKNYLQYLNQSLVVKMGS